MANANTSKLDIGIPDSIRLAIQIGGLLILIGMTFQNWKTTEAGQEKVAVAQERLSAEFAQFRLKAEVDMADIRARLHAIEREVRGK